MITNFDLLMIVIGLVGTFSVIACLQEMHKTPVAFVGFGLGCGCLLAFSFWAAGGLHVPL